jgi:iron complex outermembrane receptor protein
VNGGGASIRTSRWCRPACGRSRSSCARSPTNCASAANSAANTLTVGGYYANYKSDDVWYLGNSHLMTATPNARLINVSLNNGVVVSNNGKTAMSSTRRSPTYNGQQHAGFMADEWKINDRIKRRRRRAPRAPEPGRLDLEPGRGDTDNNPLTVYNNGTSMPTGSFTGLSAHDSANSFTGRRQLYKLTKDASVFVRANTGHTFIYFDDLRNAGTQAKVNDRNGVPNPKVTQYEVGFKTANAAVQRLRQRLLHRLHGISFQQITTDRRAELGQRLEGQGRGIRTGAASGRKTCS